MVWGPLVVICQVGQGQLGLVFEEGLRVCCSLCPRVHGQRGSLELALHGQTLWELPLYPLCNLKQ